MTTPGTAPSVDELLAHADWVRQLARQLVRDEARADDVVQATWAAALERPPRDRSNLRAWLAEVARNAARALGRADARRRGRERSVARPEALPSTAELAERASLQVDLVQRVLALDEVYRAVLLLRYFEELSHEEIAARLGVPAATVRTRHARALEQLRERLTREHGDRATWCSALATLTRSPRGKAALVTGGVIVGLKLKLAAAAVVVALAAWIGWSRSSGETQRVDASPDVAGAELVAPGATRAADVAVVDAPRSALAAAPAEPAAPVASTPAARVRGRLIDVEGRPLLGVALIRTDPRHAPSRCTAEELEHEIEHVGDPRGFSRMRLDACESTPRVEVAPDGTFALDVLPREPSDPPETEARPRVGAVFVWQRGWVTLASDWRALPSGEPELLVAAAPSRVVRGIVVDARGTPVSGAHVNLTFRLSTSPKFPWVLDAYSSNSGGYRRTADDGTFEFVAQPRVDELEIEANQGGFGTRRERVPLDARAEALQLVLKWPTGESRAGVDIVGRVVDRSGQGVAGATVALSTTQTSSAATGVFRLSLGPNEFDHALREAQQGPRSDALVAMLPGVQAAVLEDFGARLADPAAREGIVLQLGPPTLAISGRVVTEHGAPLAGFEVLLLDPTSLRWTSLTVEAASCVEAPAGMLAGRTRTDAAGRFDLGGLRERAYRVRAVSLDQLVAVDSRPTAAGATGLELVVPDDAWRLDVRGRLVSRRGEALAGATIRVEFPRADPNLFDGDRGVQVATSDERGAFVIPRVPRKLGRVCVAGPQLERTLIDVAEFSPGIERECVVPALARFSVELTDAASATTLGVIDASGKPLDVKIYSPDSSTLLERAPLREGRSRVCEVGDDAATLILFAGEREVRRVPLELSCSEVRVIRL